MSPERDLKLGHGERAEERGQTMVETALILLSFFMVFFAIFEGCRLIQVQQSLTDAARLGVRLKVAPDSGTNNRPDYNDVRNLVDDFLGAAAIYGATTTVTPVPCNTAVGAADCIQVTVTCDRQMLLIGVPILPTNTMMRIAARVVMRNLYS